MIGVKVCNRQSDRQTDRQTDRQILRHHIRGVCGFFLSVQFATSLVALLARGWHIQLVNIVLVQIIGKRMKDLLLSKFYHYLQVTVCSLN